MPDLLRAQIDLSDQVIFDVTDHQAVRAILTHEMTETLRHRELRFAEGAFLVAIPTGADLLEERVIGGVEDK